MVDGLPPSIIDTRPMRNTKAHNVTIIIDNRGVTVATLDRVLLFVGTMGKIDIKDKRTKHD